jgi:hypothetical protein
MDITGRLRLFIEMYGDIPVRDDFATNLCQDALAEIEILRAPRILGICECRAGSIVSMWSTDGNRIWCGFCGKDIITGKRP